jgi:hypothetical protein
VPAQQAGFPLKVPQAFLSFHLVAHLADEAERAWTPFELHSSWAAA